MSKEPKSNMLLIHLIIMQMCKPVPKMVPTVSCETRMKEIELKEICIDIDIQLPRFSFLVQDVVVVAVVVVVVVVVVDLCRSPCQLTSIFTERSASRRRGRIAGRREAKHHHHNTSLEICQNIF